MPVTLHVVTGILGSGKTTVLRHLIEGPGIEGVPAVVVGEFAEQGFDADMLRASGAHVLQVAHTAQDASGERFHAGARELVAGGRHRRVYIETSGVTRISQVAARLLDDPVIAERAVLGPTVTVLDAGSFAAHEAHFAAQLWGQVAVADVVVVNKTDKVHQDALSRIRSRILEHAPAARVLFSYMGQIRRAEVTGDPPEGFRPRLLDVTWGDDAPAEFESFVYRSDRVCYDRVLFGHRLLNLPGGRIARFKGVLRSYDRSWSLNGMPGQLDWESTPVSGDTAIAFIGFDLDARRQAITALLDEELVRQADDGR